MPGPDPRFLLAYGPAPGVELIPYFLALLAWVGLALAGIFVRPLTALFRRLRKGKGAPQVEPKGGMMTASLPESSGEGSHDQA